MHAHIYKYVYCWVSEWCHRENVTGHFDITNESVYFYIHIYILYVIYVCKSLARTDFDANKDIAASFDNWINKFPILSTGMIIFGKFNKNLQGFQI